MAGLANASDFQAYIEQQSQFNRGARIFQYNAQALSATTTVTGLFSDCLADPSCKGISIEKFVIVFNNGETWDATNNFTFALSHDKSSDANVFLFDGNAVGAAGAYYVDMEEHEVVAGVSYANFVADSETFSLVLTEEGTATLSDVHVIIEYRPIIGANPALGTNVDA